MLLAFSRPHSTIAIPLQYARDFTFSTSLDGDEEGRIVLSPILAKQAVSFQIGDDLSIYCTNLSKTVWRGQIERIEETKDGELIIEALGFGALQREARISVVLGLTGVSNWQVLGVNDLPGTGYSSRSDLWDWSVTNGLVEIKTKTTFTINSSNLFFLAFIFEQPERYYWIGQNNQNIRIDNLYFYGLSNGIRVAPISNAPQYNSTAVQCGTFTLFNTPGSWFETSTTGNCFGWVVGIAASGNETTAGATRVTFTASINVGLSGPLDFAKVTNALNARGGVCKITGNVTIAPQIVKPNTSLPDLFEKNVKAYIKKRFNRDLANPNIHFFGESPFVWLFPTGQFVNDISQTPGRFFSVYQGARVSHTTTPKSVTSIESKRQLAKRFKEEGTFRAKSIADIYELEREKEYKTRETAFSVDLDNNQYELRTATGAFVPNWAADVGDLASSLYSFVKLPIVSRTITKERTTYTVENAPSDALALFRRL
jgi:hypothetical protein